jgi:hypothetical protein
MGWGWIARLLLTPLPGVHRSPGWGWIARLLLTPLPGVHRSPG